MFGGHDGSCDCDWSIVGCEMSWEASFTYSHYQASVICVTLALLSSASYMRFITHVVATFEYHNTVQKSSLYKLSDIMNDVCLVFGIKE